MAKTHKETLKLAILSKDMGEDHVTISTKKPKLR
jgi:hypothetical protein